MIWNTETEFVQAFTSSIMRDLKGNSLSIHIWRELATGYGRPDVVAVDYEPRVFQDRPIYGTTFMRRPSLSKEAAFIVSYLVRRRWVRIETLANCLYRSVRRYIEELSSRELIVVEDDRVRLRPIRDILAIKRIRLFEAKLHQWRQGAEQAERNLWFTNESYILMPPKSQRSVSSMSSECARRGIGLGFYDSDSGFQTVLKPAKSGFLSSPLVWMLNERLWEGHNDRGFLCDDSNSTSRISPTADS